MALLFGLLAGLSATSAFLGPVAAPRRAVPLNVIETAPEPTEQEIFSEATSISGALAELWSILANPPPPGDFRAMYFPQCEGLKRPPVWKSTSVSMHRQFFTKSFLGDDAAVLARSSGEEFTSPRRRAGVASMAWRTTRRFSTNAP